MTYKKNLKMAKRKIQLSEDELVGLIKKIVAESEGEENLKEGDPIEDEDFIVDEGEKDIADQLEKAEEELKDA